MRAKTVNENINFERGQSPKKSLGIGHQDEIELMGLLKSAYRYLEDDEYDDYEQESDSDPENRKIIMEIISIFSSRPNKKILSKFEEIEDQILMILSQWEDSVWEAGDALSELKYTISTFMDEHTSYIKENIDFKRGTGPKNSMGIGFSKELKDIFISHGFRPSNWDPAFTIAKLKDLVDYAINAGRFYQNDMFMYQSLFLSRYEHPKVYNVDIESDFYKALSWAVNKPAQVVIDLLNCYVKYNKKPII